MASKPFYSIEEVCEKLGKSEDEVKALVREGELREFRDAGKVFFKAEDINKLAGPTEDPSEEKPGGLDDGLPDLAEDSSGGTSIIGLEPLEGEEETEEDEDASADTDTGEKKEDTVITASGIGVFDDDELEIDADPMAETQVTEGATEDQVSLDGGSSGSGLLDLAREADDTALGADLLDEIYPGEDEGEGEAEAEPVEAVAEEEEAAAEPEAEPEPVEEATTEEGEVEEAYEEAGAGQTVQPAAAISTATDPMEGLFSGLLVGALLLIAVAVSVVAGAIQGFVPDYGRWLGTGMNAYIFLGGGVLLVIITLIVGWFLGRAFGPRRR